MSEAALLVLSVVISVAAAGLMLGPLITALLPFQSRLWWLWPALRVLAQLGGSLAIGGAIAWATGSVLPVLLAAPLGAALCFTSLLALSQQPRQLTGTVLQVQQDRRRIGIIGLVPSNPTLHVAVHFQPDGQDATVLTLRGLQATRALRLLPPPGTPVSLEVLRPLGVILSATPA